MAARVFFLWFVFSLVKLLLTATEHCANCCLSLHRKVRLKGPCMAVLVELNRKPVVV